MHYNVIFADPLSTWSKKLVAHSDFLLIAMQTKNMGRFPDWKHFGHFREVLQTEKTLINEAKGLQIGNTLVSNQKGFQTKNILVNDTERFAEWYYFGHFAD